MRILLILVAMLAVSCTTVVEMTTVTEKEYHNIYCKFVIVGGMDTANYQYSATLYTVTGEQLELDVNNLNDLTDGEFITEIPSIGGNIWLKEYDKKTMIPNRMCDTYFGDTLNHYLQGDKNSRDKYKLNMLE